MTSQFEFLLLIAAIGFGMSSLIETTSWTLRAMSNKSNQGLFNAKANIYLYGGRFFALFFMFNSLLVKFNDNGFIECLSELKIRVSS